MTPRHRFLATIYEKFNARQAEAILVMLDPDIDWPNGMEGGRMHGRGEVRAYWLRQWAHLDPRVEPKHYGDDNEGRVVIDVHQVVRDRKGNLLLDQMVQHVYTIEDGLVARMDIRKAEPA